MGDSWKMAKKIVYLQHLTKLPHERCENHSKPSISCLCPENDEIIMLYIFTETITVGENGVNDKQSFLRAFYEQVQRGQDRMFWCTSSQLDESIVTQFQDYLGRESGDQRAQSQDSGSEGSLLRSTSNPC